jgi:hypothetical protein
VHRRIASGLAVRGFRAGADDATSRSVLRRVQYSCVYVVLTTDSPNVLLEGYGLTFTLGRGNEIICDMCRSLEHLVVGKDLEADILPDMMGWSRTLTQDGQLRWIGPECVLLAACYVGTYSVLCCQRFTHTVSGVDACLVAGRACFPWPVAL